MSLRPMATTVHNHHHHQQQQQQQLKNPVQTISSSYYSDDPASGEHVRHSLKKEFKQSKEHEKQLRHTPRKVACASASFMNR
jgi:hypothetical protein